MIPRAPNVKSLSAYLLILFLSSNIYAQECNDGLACTFEGIGDNSYLEFDIGNELPILSEFELEYMGSDHHVKRIAVGLSPSAPGKFIFMLQDNDRSERIRARTRYYRYERTARDLRRFRGISDDSDVITSRSVTRTGCRGQCLVEIPGFDKGRYLFFLTGFDFSFQQDDRHLREIRIWPVGDIAGSSSVFTSFKDDSNENLYDVTLQYVLLPVDHTIEGVLYGSIVSSVDRDGAVHFPRNRFSGRAISGFGASFAENDEHLLKIGIHVTREGGKVTFRDNDAKENIVPYIASWRLPVE